MNRETRLWEILQIITAILLTVITGISGWTVTTVISHGEKLAATDERISAIESNRFTRADALILMQGSAKETLQIWNSISEVKASLDNKIEAEDIPSPEVVRWLERLEDRVHDLEGN